MLTVPIFSLDPQDRALTYTGTRAKVSVSYVPGGVGLGLIGWRREPFPKPSPAP